MLESEIVRAILLGVTVFLATNIDDVFILLGFFASGKMRFRDILVGQYLGLGALVLFSFGASLVALVVPTVYIGLLGLAPIVIGFKELRELWEGDDDDDDDDDEPMSNAKLGHIAIVAAVTIANGGDNIGVYTPLFAVRSRPESTIIILNFAVLTGIWCAMAQWLVNHPTAGAPIRRYGQMLMPIVLIGVGIMVLYEAGTMQWLWKMV